MFETPHASTKLVSNIENCDPPWCSLHLWLVPYDLCELFESWEASGACPGSIFVDLFDPQKYAFLRHPIMVENLETVRKVAKQIFRDLSLLQLGPHWFLLWNYDVERKFLGQDFELCEIEWCQAHIFLQRLHGVNLEPAVDRQPGSPRGETRREGSACAPSAPCELFDASEVSGARSQ